MVDTLEEQVRAWIATGKIAEDRIDELKEERAKLKRALKEVYLALKSEADVHHKGVWGQAWMAKADIEALLK